MVDGGMWYNLLSCEDAGGVRGSDNGQRAVRDLKGQTHSRHIGGHTTHKRQMSGHPVDLPDVAVREDAERLLGYISACLRLLVQGALWCSRLAL